MSPSFQSRCQFIAPIGAFKIIEWRGRSPACVHPTAGPLLSRHVGAPNQRRPRRRTRFGSAPNSPPPRKRVVQPRAACKAPRRKAVGSSHAEGRAGGLAGDFESASAAVSPDLPEPSEDGRLGRAGVRLPVDNGGFRLPAAKGRPARLGGHRASNRPTASSRSGRRSRLVQLGDRKSLERVTHVGGDLA